LGDKTSEPSAADNVGLILSQSPEADKQVPLGTGVSVVVGSAQKKRVPDVRKLSLRRASLLLEENGFRTGSVTKKPGEAENGTVISQDPGPGKLEVIGSKVDLVVSMPVRDNSLIDRVLGHPSFSKVGISGPVIRKRMLELGLDNATKAKALFSGPDEDIKKKLAIPTVRGVRALKRIVKEVIGNI